jgi:hypothetical protein
MSLINTLTHGLIYRDGEYPKGRSWGGGWDKRAEGTYWISSGLLDLQVYIKYLPVWLLSLASARWAQKIIGNAFGYGSCCSCGMPWKYVKGKTISFSESEGMFPLCETCFDRLTPEEIDPYIEQLVQKWLDDNVKYKFKWSIKQSPQEVIDAAKAEVRRMKQKEEYHDL